ncbi:MAG: hypothetical protein ACI4NW_03245 [Stenotrophomonas sp.]
MSRSVQGKACSTAKISTIHCSTSAEGTRSQVEQAFFENLPGIGAGSCPEFEFSAFAASAVDLENRFPV